MTVFALRRLFLAHRHAAALICIAALALRMLIPAGYMISGEHGQLAVTICSNSTAKLKTMQMPSTHHAAPGHEKAGDHGKVEMPCAFASLSVQALGSIDPAVLLAAIAFAMALALSVIRVLGPPTRPYLRPPLRGPPALL